MQSATQQRTQTHLIKLLSGLFEQRIINQLLIECTHRYMLFLLQSFLALAICELQHSLLLVAVSLQAISLILIILTLGILMICILIIAIVTTSRHD